MQIYNNQESMIRPQETLIAHGIVREHKNIQEKIGVKDGLEYKYYTYDIWEYTQIEYTEKMTIELAESKQEIKHLQEENAALVEKVALNEETLLSLILG